MSITWSQEHYVRAYMFAAHAHQGQLVPGTALPYIVHISLVSMEVVAALGHEPDPDGDLAIQCALLHDVLEDTSVSYDELEHIFGIAVAQGVQALTKNSALPKAIQMADSLARIRQQPPAVWKVKLADRITNLQPPPASWSATKIEQYRDEAEQIYAALHTASPYLACRLQQRIAAYRFHHCKESRA